MRYAQLGSRLDDFRSFRGCLATGACPFTPMPESKISPMQPRFATNHCTPALPENLLRTVTHSMDQLCHVPACISSRENERFRVLYSAKDAWSLSPLGLHRIFFRGADDTCSFPGHGPATEQHAEETGCRNHDKSNLRIANRRCRQCIQHHPAVGRMHFAKSSCQSVIEASGLKEFHSCRSQLP